MEAEDIKDYIKISDKANIATIREIYGNDAVDKAILMWETSIRPELFSLKLMKNKYPEQYDALKPAIMSDIKETYLNAMLTGASLNEKGVMSTTRYEERYPVSDYMKSKDFCVMVSYNDNDFGGYMEEAGQIYADRYNELARQIDMYYSEADHMVDYYKKELEKLESPESIMKVIRLGFISSRLKDIATDKYNEDEKDALDSSGYLKLDSPETYTIGKYADIEKAAIDETKTWGYDNKDLDECWMNGEFLFLIVEGGRMKVIIK